MMEYGSRFRTTGIREIWMKAITESTVTDMHQNACSITKIRKYSEGRKIEALE
jgi:hypothetical protein